MEEGVAHRGEARRRGRFSWSVHVQGATAATEARGGLDGASQRLGTMAKWVRGWPEELVAEWIEEWTLGSA